MHEDDVLDAMERIDFSTSPTKAEEFEAMAASLTTGEHGRVSFLLAAGEHRQMRGEHGEARRLYDAAIADGGESPGAPLAQLLSLALETGDDARATDCTAQLRDLSRADRLVPDDYHRVGDVFRGHGRLRDALRWFSIPLSSVDPEDVDDLAWWCLLGRRQVREELGLPRDRYDQVADAELARRQPPA